MSSLPHALPRVQKLPQPRSSLSWASLTSSPPHPQVMYLLLHTVKGTPFETPDQGKDRLLTHWEQIDYGMQCTSSRKFLSISPVVL